MAKAVSRRRTSSSSRKLNSSRRPKPLSPKAGVTRNTFCKGGKMRKR